MEAAGVTGADIAGWLEGIDSFVFDIDGVLWTGAQMITGVDKVLHMLKRLGKSLTFVTNNATKSVTMYKAKFKSHGLDLDELGWFISAGVAAAEALRDADLPKGSQVYVVGEPGLHDTIRDVVGDGVTTLGLEDCGKGLAEVKALMEGTKKSAGGGSDLALKMFDPDDTISAVVSSFDGALNYFKIAKASTLARLKPSIPFIITNKDKTSPLMPGMLVPGGGSCAAPVETAACRPGKVVGKPSEELCRIVIKRQRLVPERTCMVGDRLDTDMLFGKRGGFQTLLVLSGATSRGGCNSVSMAASATPDAVANSIATLLRAP